MGAYRNVSEVGTRPEVNPARLAKPAGRFSSVPVACASGLGNGSGAIHSARTALPIHRHTVWFQFQDYLSVSIVHGHDEPMVGPRMELTDVSLHSKGLIADVGCLDSE